MPKPCQAHRTHAHTYSICAIAIAILRTVISARRKLKIAKTKRFSARCGDAATLQNSMHSETEDVLKRPRYVFIYIEWRTMPIWPSSHESNTRLFARSRLHKLTVQFQNLNCVYLFYAIYLSVAALFVPRRVAAKWENMEFLPFLLLPIFIRFQKRMATTSCAYTQPYEIVIIIILSLCVCLMSAWKSIRSIKIMSTLEMHKMSKLYECALCSNAMMRHEQCEMDKGTRWRQAHTNNPFINNKNMMR